VAAQKLALPPGTALIITPPSGDGDANSTSLIELKNDMCSITLKVENCIPVGDIGEYRVIWGLSDEEAQRLATLMYIVEARIHYSRLRAGHPDMKSYKAWAKQLIDELRNEFDEQIIWARVKENDLRLRHYPAETIGPHGRSPKRTPNH
jgi:hypothetical protein